MDFYYENTWYGDTVELFSFHAHCNGVQAGLSLALLGFVIAIFIDI